MSNAIAGSAMVTIAPTSWQQSAAQSQRLFALSSATIKPVSLIRRVLAFLLLLLLLLFLLLFFVIIGMMTIMMLLNVL